MPRVASAIVIIVSLLIVVILLGLFIGSAVEVLDKGEPRVAGLAHLGILSIAAFGGACGVIIAALAALIFCLRSGP